MTLERDHKFLAFRIILLFLSFFLFFFIGNKILIQNLQTNFSISFVVLLTSLVNILINYFLVYEIKYQYKTLHFKNIYNISLKKINLNNVKEKKIIYQPINSKIVILFFLFGKKYEETIWIKLKINNNKTFSFNGQIISSMGLQSFSKLLKNQ